ncbi:SMC-Scp complex subunit ScpB [Microbulbifer sediminum]|uniref:SMC-Scp complex subunit ScpB n=1 Tax=Microbulbifer sediminum TaxID=2904250 RepID=UPI001F02686C|nr:SMC-Scp complex subunit ScpB [Microbulbifer sediminum]
MTIAPELLRRIVEGALLAAGQPLNEDKLLSLIDEGERPEKSELRQVLQDIADSCAERGFELRQVASGWRYQVPEDLAPWVNRLWEEKPQKYSRAILETLAIIAYRQPITRGDIEEIRGVAVSSHIVKTLTERGWIKVVGQRDVPGKPSLYATTREFLDYFNLRSLDDLPTLAEIRDIESLNQSLDLGDGTPVKQAEGETEAAGEQGAEPAPSDEGSTESGAGTTPEAAAADGQAASPGDETEAAVPGQVGPAEEAGDSTAEAAAVADSEYDSSPGEGETAERAISPLLPDDEENPDGGEPVAAGDSTRDADTGAPAPDEDAPETAFPGQSRDELAAGEESAEVADSGDTLHESVPDSDMGEPEPVASQAGEGDSIAASLPASTLFGGAADSGQPEAETTDEAESQETVQPETTNS